MWLVTKSFRSADTLYFPTIYQFANKVWPKAFIHNSKMLFKKLNSIVTIFILYNMYSICILKMGCDGHAFLVLHSRVPMFLPIEEREHAGTHFLKGTRVIVESPSTQTVVFCRPKAATTQMFKSYIYYYLCVTRSI